MKNIARAFLWPGVLLLALSGADSFAQSKPAVPDGMVDGSKTPDLIPMDTASRLVLYSLRVPVPATESDLSNQEARLNRMSLSREDKEMLKKLLMGFQEEFARFQASLSTSSPPPNPRALGAQRDELAKRYHTLIMNALTADGRAKFTAYVMAERRKMYNPPQ